MATARNLALGKSLAVPAVRSIWAILYGAPIMAVKERDRGLA